MEVVDIKDAPSVPLVEEGNNEGTALVQAKSDRVAIREMWEFACVFDFFRVCEKLNPAYRMYLSAFLDDYRHCISTTFANGILCIDPQS